MLRGRQVNAGISLPPRDTSYVERCVLIVPNSTAVCPKRLGTEPEVYRQQGCSDMWVTAQCHDRVCCTRPLYL